MSQNSPDFRQGHTEHQHDKSMTSTQDFNQFHQMSNQDDMIMIANPNDPYNSKQYIGVANQYNDPRNQKQMFSVQSSENNMSNFYRQVNDKQ